MLKKYFKLYLGLCTHFHLRDIPTLTHTLSLFEEFQLQSYKEPKSIASMLATIKHLHQHLDTLTFGFASVVPGTELCAPCIFPPRPSLPYLCTLALLQTLVRAVFIKELVFTIRSAQLLFTLSCAVHSTFLHSQPLMTHSFQWWLHWLSETGKTLRIAFAKETQGAVDAFTVPLMPSSNPVVFPVALTDTLLRARRGPPQTASLLIAPTNAGLTLTAPGTPRP